MPKSNETIAISIVIFLAALSALVAACGNQNSPENADDSPQTPEPASAVDRQANTPTAPTNLRTSREPSQTPTATRTRPTPIALAGRITPTATRTPRPTPTQSPNAEEPIDLSSELAREYRARCLRYVRENQSPVTYAEFRELDPDNMSDLERTLWRQIDSSDAFRLYCQDYWSEPLSMQNAHKRNQYYRASCYEQLWRGHLDFVTDETGWNQYARIANWMDIPGDTLLSMSPKPLAFVEAALKRYILEDELEPEDEWYGIIEAWPQNDHNAGPELGHNSQTTHCINYYPQLFTGRWMPLDTAITRQGIEDLSWRERDPSLQTVEVITRQRIESLLRPTPTSIPSDMRKWIDQKDRQVYYSR